MEGIKLDTRVSQGLNQEEINGGRRSSAIAAKNLVTQIDFAPRRIKRIKNQKNQRAT